MATSLLLHCNSTPIIDECGHPVTAVGDAQISSTESKFGGYSLLLDGAGDYLSIGDYADAELGSGDFTLEAWIRFTGYSNGFGGFYAGVILGKDASGARAFHWKITGTASSYDSMVFSTAGTELSASYSFSLNTWYHVAVCKSGTSLRFFVDGAQIGTTQTHSTTISDVSTALTVGGTLYSGFEYHFKGYLDEIRVTKGEALYTANFIAPPQPFFYNNVVLYLPMDGANGGTTFIDCAGHAVTMTGTVTTSTTQSKFGGSSAYFSAAGNYLTSSADSGSSFGTGDFTIEFFVYLPTLSGQQNMVTTKGTTAATIYTIASGLRLYAAGADRITGGTLSINTWMHIALCRHNNITKLFLNGTQVGTSYTDNNNYDSTQFDVSTVVPYGLNGAYLDDLRICRAAKYTADFTPPTTAHEYEYTKLLIHADGNNAQTCIRDETGKAITTAGNAKISTAQYNFGGSALSFDGTDDYITLNESVDFNGFTATSAWTVELWVKQDSNATGVLCVIGDNAGGLCAQFNIEASGSNQSIYLRPQGGTTGYWIQNAYAFDTNWHHLAFVCTGSGYYIFRDGVSLGTPASFSWTTNNIPNGVIIGATYITSYSTFFTGYLDEIRITKGLARYTTNFTPPSAPFALIGQQLYSISGVVRDDTGAPAARTVRLYKRSTGELVQQATSNATTGQYLFTRSDSNEYVLMFLDNDTGTQYNAIVFDRVVPG